MTTSIMLPRADGSHFLYTLGTPSSFAHAHDRVRSRVVYAAAHVVGNPLVDATAPAILQIDWDATADQAGLLRNPEIAVERMRKVLAVAGFDAVGR